MTASTREFDTLTNGCDQFSDFFTDKVQKIRTELDTIRHNDAVSEERSCFTRPLSSLQPTSEEEIHKMTKTCELDPLPAKQMKQCLQSVVPVVTRITNMSLAEGNVPTSLKEARVRPLIKKPSLDRDVLKNYRPVSNLPLVSKVIEKVVAARLCEHLHVDTQNMQEPFQSAYRKHHSTETALVRVCNDIRTALDDKQGTLLVLLDLSSAFDTIDHQILLARLEKRFGLQGSVLQWMESYLQDRSQRVVIGQASSTSQPLNTGVPQGSVLGPMGFSLYVQPIGEIIRRHGLQFHHYADDLQLLITFSLNPASLLDALRRLEACIAEIKAWMAANYLKVNDEKTEFLPVVPRSARSLLDGLTINVGGITVAAVDSVRNLGAHLDCHMDMAANISMTIKSCYFHLRHVGQIRKFLPKKTMERVVNAMITSRIDYCNSLLYGTTDKNLARLQRLQNVAAKLIMGGSKYDHVTPILRDLHWLPIRSRIHYKIMVLVHKAVHNAGPVYLRDLINMYSPGRVLRSGGCRLLARPRTRTRAGDATFTSATADLWNDLPAPLRLIEGEAAFKRALKTHYFTQHYS
jgi:hypothetical protein